MAFVFFCWGGGWGQNGHPRKMRLASTVSQSMTFIPRNGDKTLTCKEFWRDMACWAGGGGGEGGVSVVDVWDINSYTC